MGSLFKRGRTTAFRTVILLSLFSTACAPREVVLPKLGIAPPALRDFPDGYQPPLSNETGRPVVGFGGDGGGVHRVPVIFVHGNTVSARFWLPARAYFKGKGYTGDELWALGYGWDDVRSFDSNDLSVPTLEAFINAVTNDIYRRTGQRVPQVDIIAHSMGVTLVRQWMMQENAWHRVRHFIGACGANHGTWTARPDGRNRNRTVAFELHPGSPWLEQLNRGGETPGPTRYMTVYDGSGWADALFAPGEADSPQLKGAYNLAFNSETGSHFDHLELPRVPPTMDAMLKFLSDPPAPVGASAPPIVRTDSSLQVDQAGAKLYCAEGGAYPSRQTPAVTQLEMQAGSLYTCFALDDATGLASPMRRFKRALSQDTAVIKPPLQVSASLRSGAYENPVKVKLSTNDPGAFIVYTTSGTVPNDGSPLYRQAIYVPATVTVTAVAIAADGRKSAPARFRYDISLERVDQVHTLERQFDPSTGVAR